MPGAGWHRPEGCCTSRRASGRRLASAGQRGAWTTCHLRGGEGRGALGLRGVPVGRAITMGVWTLEKPHASLFRPNAGPSSLPTVHASVVYRAGSRCPTLWELTTRCVQMNPTSCLMSLMLVTEETPSPAPGVPAVLVPNV